MTPHLLLAALLAAAPSAPTAPAGAAPPAPPSAPALDPRRLPFSPAVRARGMVYLSGQLGNLPGTVRLAPGGIDAEARQAMDNVGAILKAEGLSFADVVQCRVYLADMADWPAFNAVYIGYFNGLRLPARSALGANGLALGAKVEIECLAEDRERGE